MHEYGKYFSLMLLNIKCYRGRWPLLLTETICVLFEVTKGIPTVSGLRGCHTVSAVIELLDPDEEGITIPPTPVGIYQSTVVISQMT